MQTNNGDLQREIHLLIFGFYQLLLIVLHIFYVGDRTVNTLLNLVDIVFSDF
jgi:hypothetical protein